MNESVGNASKGLSAHRRGQTLDPALQLVIDISAQPNTELWITIVADSKIFSGIIIPERVWIDQFSHNMVPGSTDDFRRTFANVLRNSVGAPADQTDEPNGLERRDDEGSIPFIHLKNAYTWEGPRRMNMGLVRIRTSSISLWTSGGMGDAP